MAELAELKEQLEGIQGMLMQSAMTQAKFIKDLGDRTTNIESMLLSQATQMAKLGAAVGRSQEATERVESMSMQAAMGKSKDQKYVVDNLERLEGMAMAAATNNAKMEKKLSEQSGGAEAMLMQASMTNAKVAKDMSDRTTNIEAMLMSHATQIAKVAAAVRVLPAALRPEGDYPGEGGGGDDGGPAGAAEISTI
jgi:hypothetical protein